jgi:phosphate transport system protein
MQHKVLNLSRVIEANVHKAIQALMGRDVKLAQTVIDSDEDIDQMEVEVEEQCIRIIALYQPVAVDLRYVIAVMKVNNDLERVGDLAVNIAERAIFLSQEDPVRIPFDFDDMAQKSTDMLHQSLEALFKRNKDLAQDVCGADDAVDELNRQMYDKVYAGIRTQPEDVEAFVHYLSVSRHLERIADYATNIAEDAIYMIDGRIVRHQPEEFPPKKRPK